MVKTQIYFVVVSFTLSSCMTLASFTDEVEEDFNKPDKCPEDCTIHRVYSGTSVDICLLRSGSEAGQGGAIAFWDLPFSLVADTVVLPYTIYKQATVGGSFSVPTGKNSKCDVESGN